MNPNNPTHDYVNVIRKAVLMEDEGRQTIVMTTNRERAKKWIKDQKDKFFKPSDYYISKVKF